MEEYKEGDRVVWRGREYTVKEVLRNDSGSITHYRLAFYTVPAEQVAPANGK